MVTSLDKFGRVIIPKKIRKQLGITPKTILNIVDDGQRIIIEPLPSEDVVVEKSGFLIYTGKIKGDLEKFLKEDREWRAKKIWGDTH